MPAILDTSTHLLYEDARFSITTNSGEPKDMSILYTIERSSTDSNMTVYIPTSNTRTVKVIVTAILEEPVASGGERARPTTPLAYFVPSEATLYIHNRTGTPEQGTFNYIVSVLGERPTNPVASGLYVASPNGAINVDQEYKSYNLYEHYESFDREAVNQAGKPPYNTGVPYMSYDKYSVAVFPFTPTAYAPIVVCRCQNYFSVEALIRRDGLFVGVSVYVPYGYAYMSVSMYTAEVPSYACGYRVLATPPSPPYSTRTHYSLIRVKDTAASTGVVVRNVNGVPVYNSTLIPIRITHKFDVPFSGAVQEITSIPSTQVSSPRDDLPYDVVTTPEYGILNSSSSYLHAYRGAVKYKRKCVARNWFGGCTAHRNYYYHVLSYSKSLVALVGTAVTGIGTTYAWTGWKTSTREDNDWGINIGPIDLGGGSSLDNAATEAAKSDQANTVALINSLGFPLAGNTGVNGYVLPKGFVCALNLPVAWRTLGQVGDDVLGYVPTTVPNAATIDMDVNAIALANIEFITTTATPIVFAMASSSQTFYTDNPTYASVFNTTPAGGTYLYQYKSSIVQPKLGRIATFLDPTDELAGTPGMITYHVDPTGTGYQWQLEAEGVTKVYPPLETSDVLPVELTSSYIAEQQCYTNIRLLLPIYYDEYEAANGSIDLPAEARTSLEYFDRLPGPLCLRLVADALTISSTATFNDDPDMYREDVYEGKTLSSLLLGSVTNSANLVENPSPVSVNLCFDSFYSAAKYYSGPLTSSLTYDYQNLKTVENYPEIRPEGVVTTFHSGPGSTDMYDTTVVTVNYASEEGGDKDSSTVTTFHRLRGTRFGTFSSGTVFPKFTNLVYVNKEQGYWYELTFEETLELFNTYGNTAVSPTYQALRDDINSALQAIVDTGEYLLMEGGHPFEEAIVRDPRVPGVSVQLVDSDNAVSYDHFVGCTFTTADTGTTDAPTITLTCTPVEGAPVFTREYPKQTVLSIYPINDIISKSPANTHGEVERVGRNPAGDSPYSFDFSTASSKHPEYYLEDGSSMLVLKSRAPQVLDSTSMFTYLSIDMQNRGQ